MLRVKACGLFLVLVFAGALSCVDGFKKKSLEMRRKRDGNFKSGYQRAARSVGNTCTSEFAKIPGHTMCMEDDRRVIRSGVSPEDKNTILRLHNEVRANVQPPATDLTPLVWDDRLAAVAQKWSQRCQYGHDKERSVPSLGMGVGQNMAAGYSNWEGAVGGWSEEVEKYHFGIEPDSYLGKGGWKAIGHYTQMVQNSTYLVGCGFSECRNTRYGRFYVCNYASGQSRLAEPYTKGPRCGVCPTSCSNGLCDCGGKVCLNSGKLDKNSCTCKCQDIYSGDTCQDLNCPATDPFYCGTQITASSCETYYNVPFMCPYLCRLCTGSNGDMTVNVGSAVTEPPSDTFTSTFGCKYEGKRASAADCKSYGKNGTDTQFCASQGGEFGCEECTAYYNIKTDYCPVMCGICDGESNGGAPTKPPVEVFTSDFGCKYEGKRFTVEECKGYGENGTDSQFCANRGGDFGCHECTAYYNVKTDYCPVMCGFCDAPCGGKTCVNDGKLDTSTCTCQCKPPYGGDTCATKKCPQQDQDHCNLYKDTYCSRYINVPEECPYKCGICKH